MSDEIDNLSSRGTKAPKVKAMNIKNQLRLYLEIREMSAAELSRKSGVSKQVLSLWLSGSEPKKISQVKSVAEVLGTSCDHLCFGSGQDEASRKVTEID